MKKENTNEPYRPDSSKANSSFECNKESEHSITEGGVSQKTIIKKSSIAGWVLFGFGVLFAISMFSIKAIPSAILFLIFSVAVMPIEQIRNIWLKIPNYKTWMKVAPLVILFFVAVMISPSAQEEIKSQPSDTVIETTSGEETSTTIETTEENTAIVPDKAGSDEAQKPQNPSAVSSGSVATYSGAAYVATNNNQPGFTAEQKRITKSFENYSALDSFGRCGVALACLCRDTMPAEGEERDSISNIMPTGWVQTKYDFVSGKYLYNRCHLIGWQLSAENANKQNLITGTRSFNVDGMLPYENMVADYIKETGNHVMYRVTPVFEGNNLVASGVQIEAWSVEDVGEGICFNVYCYNAQAGVSINYATGESSADGSIPVATTAAQTKAQTTKAPVTQALTSVSDTSRTVYTTPSGKRYHYDPDCGGKNSRATTLNKATSAGYTPCQKCVH